MKLSDKPRQLGVAFAQNGTKNTVPTQSSQSTKEKGIATYDSGFPPVTMTAIAAGGIPPQGNDFNGVLNDITAAIRYGQAGSLYTFDAAFAAAIGGYPGGSLVLSGDTKKIWWNTVDGNGTDPDSAGANGWVRLADRTGLYLESAKNLSDVQNINAARKNLGLGNSATRDIGTIAGTVAAGDDSRIVGAVQRTGDKMTGKLDLPQISEVGVNTDNELGGNSIAIGDPATGVKQSGDGVLDIYANGAQTFRFTPFEVNSSRPVKYTVSGFPAGSGSFAEQINTVAPFMQENWLWTPSAGGRYVPICKGTSTRASEGYTTAISFGYLLNEKTSFAIPCIHVAAGGVNMLWQFDPNSQSTYCPGSVRAGDAILQTDGNVWGTRWNPNGQWLWDAIVEQLTIRDNNINGRAPTSWVNDALAQLDANIATRATWGWVNQNFIGDMRLSSETQTGPQPFFYSLPAGCVMTGLDVSGDGNASANIGYRSLQKYVNGTWYVIGTL